MKYGICDIKKHNLDDISELVYQTEPELTKMFFGNNKTKGKKRIIKLIKADSNSFSSDKIFLAYENTNVFGIMIAYTGEEIDKEEEAKSITNSLDFFGALRLHFYEKYLVSRLLTSEIKPNEYYIGVLCVDPNYRRKGIGISLIEKVKKIAKRKNCKRVILDVSKDNTSGIKFYEKNGFRIYNEVKTTFLFQKISVYKMEYKIKKK
jgi:ribosomal protein S18 acetylase RimI-like enzyme